MACTICKDFFGNCPENAIFQNTFLFNNWAILNISKKFFLWPNFLKCEMCNVWFKFGVVHTPCGAPGHFTSTFGCTGVSHRGFHFHLWMYGGFTQGISQEILKKRWKGRWGVCTTPNLNHTLHISHFSWCTPPDAHHRTGKVLQNWKKYAFLINFFLKQIRILWRIWFWSRIFKAENTNMLISRIWIKNRYTRMMSWSVSAEKKICTLYFSMVNRFQALVSVSGGRVREIWKIGNGQLWKAITPFWEGIGVFWRWIPIRTMSQRD